MPREGQRAPPGAAGGRRALQGQEGTGRAAGAMRGWGRRPDEGWRLMCTSWGGDGDRPGQRHTVKPSRGGQRSSPIDVPAKGTQGSLLTPLKAGGCSQHTAHPTQLIPHTKHICTTGLHHRCCKCHLKSSLLTHIFPYQCNSPCPAANERSPSRRSQLRRCRLPAGADSCPVPTCGPKRVSTEIKPPLVPNEEQG